MIWFVVDSINPVKSVSCQQQKGKCSGNIHAPQHHATAHRRGIFRAQVLPQTGAGLCGLALRAGARQATLATGRGNVPAFYGAPEAGAVCEFWSLGRRDTPYPPVWSVKIFGKGGTISRSTIFPSFVSCALPLLIVVHSCHVSVDLASV